MAKKRQISKRHQELMNCDSYLFSTEDAARLLRMNRTDFEVKLLGREIPFIPVAKNVRGRMMEVKMIRHEHLKNYEKDREVIYG